MSVAAKKAIFDAATKIEEIRASVRDQLELIARDLRRAAGGLSSDPDPTAAAPKSVPAEPVPAAPPVPLPARWLDGRTACREHRLSLERQLTRLLLAHPKLIPVATVRGWLPARIGDPPSRCVLQHARELILVTDPEHFLDRVAAAAVAEGLEVRVIRKMAAMGSLTPDPERWVDRILLALDWIDFEPNRLRLVAAYERLNVAFGTDQIASALSELVALNNECKRRPPAPAAAA